MGNGPQPVWAKGLLEVKKLVNEYLDIAHMVMNLPRHENRAFYFQDATPQLSLKMLRRRLRGQGEGKLQMRKLDVTTNEFYSAGAIELGLKLDATEEFMHKVEQAEKEAFAIWTSNATLGIYKPTWVIVCDGHSFSRVTYTGANTSTYKPYAPRMHSADVKGSFSATPVTTLFTTKYATTEQLIHNLDAVDEAIKKKLLADMYFFPGAKRKAGDLSGGSHEKAKE
ncbi:hypothetical protein WJX72_010325 [[Myrmecia] bisecta]|uniref:Uncharacterized protein n=1 Tax=[Myrmecia] bisecta TaxID=41462 RepID=A0AAW1R9H1_9CHLO